MKQCITESQLKRIISESISRILNEGGNLYGTYDDGTKFTNSQEKWRGVEGSVFIWHGANADPEIWYDGIEINAMDAEDSLWDRYVEYCREQGITPQDDADYDKWIDETGKAEVVLMDLAVKFRSTPNNCR